MPYFFRFLTVLCNNDLWKQNENKPAVKLGELLKMKIEVLLHSALNRTVYFGTFRVALVGRHRKLVGKKMQRSSTSRHS